MTPIPSGYAPVNDLNMYYEAHGAGRPLVLIHGGLSTIETDSGRVLPTFAKTRRVIAVEQQGHGHTADIDRPLTYEQMAEDTAQLLRWLEIKSADFRAISSAFHLPGSPSFPGPRTSRSCTAPIGCFR